MTLFLRPVLGAVMLLFVPATTLAQGTPSSTPSAGEAGTRRLSVCRPDIAKFCPGATGEVRRKCLKDNAASLSTECTAALADVEVKAKTMREACATDVKTHCSGAGKSKGGDGIVQCLRTNEAKLSLVCAMAFRARYAPN
jgi:hypothetical protein